MFSKKVTAVIKKDASGIPQLAITCSKLPIEALEQSVKYVQS